MRLPKLLAMPTNLIELSNCCICLQRTFRFSSVDDVGKQYTINSVSYKDKQFCPLQLVII